jgi:hypothetical protein
MGKRELKRKKGPCPRVYGEGPKPLAKNQLPLWRDIDLALEDAKDQENLSQADAIKIVSNEVIKIYKAASISTIDPKKIAQKVAKVAELRRNQIKNTAIDQRRSKVRDAGKNQKRKGKNNLRNKLKLSDVMDKLFEVKKEVPEIEKDFYRDQQEGRNMYIGPLDVSVTEQNMKEIEEQEEKFEKKEKRKRDEERLREMEKKRLVEEENKEVDREESSECSAEEREDDEMYKTSTKKPKNDTETKHMGEFFEIVERFNISETATSHVFYHFSEKKIYQSQVNRMKKKLRIKQVDDFEKDDVTAIGFDERKDRTKVEAGIGKDGSKRFEFLKEEHCAIVLWPGDVFAGHVVPRGGKAIELATDLQAFLEARPRIKTENCRVLISDGCEKMLGWKTGVHASLEKLRRRRFQRVVCYFHHLELSFEKIIMLYGVYTVSPGNFVEPWATQLSGDIHKFTIVDFQVLHHPSLLALLDSMSQKTLRDLGTDHRIFIGCLRIIITGEVDTRFAQMKIGPLIHARFTTTETRFLRSWISTESPNFEQMRITRYLVYVWAESFLTAKRKNKMVDGPRLLLLELLLSKKYCTYPEFTVLKSSMDYNGQYAHHESILVSLLASTNMEERQLGVDTIFKIREQGPKRWNTPTGQRPFKVRKSWIF